MDYYAAYLSGLSSTQKKKKKTQKHKYNNWFEKLTLTELKSLCRAAKLTVSGTKDELCIRLCHGELSSDYAYEYAPERFSRVRFEASFDTGYGSCDEFYGGSRSGIGTLPPAQQGSKRESAYTNEALKNMCREKGLVTSGKRFDLVLRLLQNKSGCGGEPKRAAGTIDEDTGVFQPKKRAKSMKPPNVEKLQEQIFKKCFPSDEVTHKWSNNKHKYHWQDCLKYMCNIIDREIFEKELYERGEENCAWELINAILNIITVGDEARRREWMAKQTGKLVFMIGGTEFELGRCSHELKFNFLPRLVKAMKLTSSKGVVAELSGKSLWAFQSCKLAEYSPYDEVDIGDHSDDWQNRKWGSFKEILNEYVPCNEEFSTKESQPRHFILEISSGGSKKTEEWVDSETTGFVPVGLKQQEQEGDVSADNKTSANNNEGESDPNVRKKCRIM